MKYFSEGNSKRQARFVEATTILRREISPVEWSMLTRQEEFEIRVSKGIILRVCENEGYEIFEGMGESRFADTLEEAITAVKLFLQFDAAYQTYLNTIKLNELVIETKKVQDALKEI